MTENEKEAAGLSRSEKALLFRSAIFGVIASIVTLWLGDVFKADGPSLFHIEVIVTCILSIVVSIGISIMGESVIEDVVKLVMFGVIWWLSIKFERFELITLGLVIGCVAGFLNNRAFGK